MRQHSWRIGNDHRHLTTNQLKRDHRHAIVLPLRPAVLDRHVLALEVAGLLQALTECGHHRYVAVRRCTVEECDHRHRRLPPPPAPYLDREQQAAPTEQCDELPPLHVRHGEFLPYALSAPPTGPRAQSSAPQPAAGRPSSPWARPEMF